MENKKLQDKVMVVTGGTGVLGEAFTRAIAEAGAVVAILGRNTRVAETRAQQVRDAGGQAEAITANVLIEEDLQRAAEMLLAKYGRIDGLVNAAGGNLPDAVVQPSQDVFSLNFGALREVFDLNLFGTLLPTQVFGKIILDSSGAGSIVNISSITAHRGLTRVLGYSLAKSAIEAYTRWFAVELGLRFGDKIRMNAIVPGFFLTEQNRNLLTNPDGSNTSRGEAIITNTPVKRYGKPDELTGALTWLLSNDSAFVNGTSIVVDGGFLAYSGV